MDYFTNLLLKLDSGSSGMDIISISEIFKCDLDNRLNLPGFHSLISKTVPNIPSTPRGGFGIFINENINYN